MFRKKTKEPAPQPVSSFAEDSQLAAAKSQGKRRPVVPSLFSSDAQLVGTLESQGEVQLDGRMQGDVRCRSLTAGENAVIDGDIIADEVVIRGRLKGNIRARKVELSSTAHVVGDIFHKTLAVQLGAYVDGAFCHTEEPLAADKRPAAPKGRTESRAAAEPELVASFVGRPEASRAGLFGRPAN